MRDLIKELIPHAPHLGLYVHPDIPPEKIRNALSDYARSMQPDEVVALYDGTLIGNARDGAVFARDRFVFQNFKLDPVQDWPPPARLGRRARHGRAHPDRSRGRAGA